VQYGSVFPRLQSRTLYVPIATYLADKQSSIAVYRIRFRSPVASSNRRLWPGSPMDYGDDILIIEFGKQAGTGT